MTNQTIKKNKPNINRKQQITMTCNREQSMLKTWKVRAHRPQNSELCCQPAVWLRRSHFTSLEPILCVKWDFIWGSVSVLHKESHVFTKDFQIRNTVFAVTSVLPAILPKHVCWEVVSFWLKATFIQYTNWIWLHTNLSASKQHSLCAGGLMNPGFGDCAVGYNIVRKGCVCSGERVS